MEEKTKDIKMKKKTVIKYRGVDVGNNETEIIKL